MQLIKKIKNYTYNERHCLGQGSFGKVYEGKSDSGLKVAIKKVQKSVVSEDSYLKTALETEITIMKRLNHPNIVRLQDVVLTVNSIYLIMEYCAGGDLKRYCRNRKLNEEEATQIIKQVVQGFQQISKHGIIHRDLKPANILVHQGVFKICDFGFAKYFGEAKMAKTCVGTPIYMSPQVLSQKPYTDKTDVWSLGVLYYELLFAKLPFTGASEQQLYTNITQNPRLIMTASSSSSKFVQNFLKGTLQVDEQSRWHWSNVFEVFELVSLGQKKSSTQNLFYKKSSNKTNNQSPPQRREHSRPDMISRNEMKNNNFFRNDKSEQDKMDPLNRSIKRSEPYKPKPKNLLALQQLAEDKPKVLQENVRFLYFILVEFLMYPVQCPSYKPFLASLYRHTINSYERKIEKDREKTQYTKVLISELQELRQLLGEVPRVKEDEPTKLASAVLQQTQRLGNYYAKGWLVRYLQKNYSYNPFV